MAQRKVEIEIDEELVDEVIRRYHLHGAREAVNLALRSLVHGPDTPGSSLDEEVDEFSNLDALRPKRSSDTA
ncbi:type II toxin-antitoxin system VapB family antitoxin [Mycobacterium sp. SM1]|uniref:type II toxin-antitoxin system VapB family antitoxin n=1 Tax=Mycobacterium sp. SM1 TaxID=2816243 RepID=UPI001BCF7CF3|nr:type II toxin-antitoxin system VapB family antitoxin [Mycobacterium sp. SM1]MBS4728743.1 type II toxin-antitoxin system VapB family antitoxin [Mycobacterium sp. SM1]